MDDNLSLPPRMRRIAAKRESLASACARISTAVPESDIAYRADNYRTRCQRRRKALGHSFVTHFISLTSFIDGINKQEMTARLLGLLTPCSPERHFTL